MHALGLADLALDASTLPTLHENSNVKLVDTRAGSSSIHEPQVSEAPAPHSSWSFERDGYRFEPNGRPFMLEIFGGSARLTRHLRELGADRIAVDWKDGKLKAEMAAILMLNLHTPAGQAALIRLSSHPSLVYVHLAPPCGTSFPAPLRSEAHPAGLPGLSARDQHHVDTANILYDFTAKMVDNCIQKNVAWSVENPRNSLMWWYPPIRALTQLTQATWPRFQHCCYGGQRSKWTGWLHSPPDMFRKLSATCPSESNSHIYAIRGKTSDNQLSRSLEPVYPASLCSAVANIVFNEVKLTRCRPAAVIRAPGTALVKRQLPPARPEAAPAGSSSLNALAY